ERLIRLGDRTGSVSLQPRQRANAINVLWDDNRLVVHLESQVYLAVVDRHGILPDGHFPHVSTRSTHVAHQLDNGVERHEPVARAHERNPRLRGQGAAQLVQADRSGRLDHGKVEGAQVIRADGVHRGEVTLWAYGHRVG